MTVYRADSNLRAFYFHGRQTVENPIVHMGTNSYQCTYIMTSSISILVRFSWFIFLQKQVCPRNLRKFAPSENFPLYGIASVLNRQLVQHRVKTRLIKSDYLNSDQLVRNLWNAYKGQLFTQAIIVWHIHNNYLLRKCANARLQTHWRCLRPCHISKAVHLSLHQS